MAKILVADKDLKSAKSIQQTLEAREGHTVEFKNENNAPNADKSYKNPKQHFIFYASEFAAALELLNKNAFDLFFINSKMLDAEPKVWVDKLKKLLTLEQNKTTSLIAITQDEDSKFARRFIDSGIEDVIHMPIDQPIFMQKFDLMLMKKINSGDRQLYSMKTDHRIDIAKSYQIEEISEFGVTIKTQLPMKQDEYVVLFGEFFGDKNIGEVVGRCYSVAPGANAGESLAAFVFIGVDNATLQNIRKWLRLEYARKKQASSAKS